MGGAYTDQLLTEIISVNGVPTAKVGGAAGGGLNLLPPLTGVPNGATGNLDVGVSGSSLSGVVPATPSTVVERDGSGQVFSVGADLGLGSLVNVGTFMAFGATVGSPNLGQSQLSGNGTATGQTLVVSAQFGQNQGGGADNNDGGTLSVQGGEPGTGGSGAAGAQGPVEIVAGGITLTVNYPVVGGASGKVYTQSPTLQFTIQDGGGIHTIVLADTNGLVLGAFTGAKLAFYTGVPIAQQTRAGQLTDNTGGSPTSTLAAIAAGAAYTQADMVAVKNALASISAKYDALETIIHNLRLST